MAYKLKTVLYATDLKPEQLGASLPVALVPPPD